MMFNTSYIIESTREFFKKYKWWLLGISGGALVLSGPSREFLIEAAQSVISIFGIDPVPTLKTIKSKYGLIIDKYSSLYVVPKEVLYSVIFVESGGNAKAYRYEAGVNDASYGLMQILYGTAKGLGYKGTADGLYDPDTNIGLGAKYLAGNYKIYKNWPLAVARYNSGSTDKVIKLIGSTDWEKIVSSKDQIAKQYSLFAKYTIPYLTKVFGKGGLVDKTRTVLV